MSQDEPTSRKDKKALRDAERHKKGKKRTHADTEEQDVAVAEEVQVEKPAKKSKKRKAEHAVEDGDTAIEVTRAEGGEEKPKRRKKQRTEQTGGGENGEDTTKASTKSRFIVFVGNLPYKTTDDSLKKHFKKLQPFTLRHRTDPKTKKSKGFAFLEFENYDRMKTCLKLYHHSMFDPENVAEDGADLTGEPEKEQLNSRGKKKTQARKINVELTAGGGGKTDARKEKIKAKNEKLDEERQRRAEAERKEREKKARKEQKNGRGAKKAEKEEAATAGANAAHGDIHPSRLAQMNV